MRRHRSPGGERTGEQGAGGEPVEPGCAEPILEAGRQLARELEELSFSPAYVYNTFEYAWEGWASYVRTWLDTPKRVLLLGMNPGPWGMAQTGVPFGEIEAVRTWLGLNPSIRKPPREHPKRPIEGLDSPRSEVSGRRLWGFFQERFAQAREFFALAAVVNYCPLVFMAESGRNVTPDKLPKAEREALFTYCDRHLFRIIEILAPVYLVGVGRFAEGRLKGVATDQTPVTAILHPSPASPAANRDWAGTVAQTLDPLFEL